MSKLNFAVKYGSLDQAKKAVAGSDTETMGHAFAMTKLLDRMRSDGDPDYERFRDEHLNEFAAHKIKASWIVDTDHVTQDHLKTIADKHPYLMDRAAKNKNASPDTLRFIYDKSSGLKYSDERGSVRYRIAQHDNLPKDLAVKLAEDPGFMRARSAAKFRLDQTMRPFPE